MSAYMTMKSQSPLQFLFILDSGTTTHICKVHLAFTFFKPTKSSIGGINMTEAELAVLGCGDVNIIISISGEQDRTVTLLNVAYAPQARDNLISESKMDKKGLEIRRKNGKVHVLKPDSTIAMEGYVHHGLYHLKCAIAPSSFEPSDIAFISTPKSNPSLEMWHHRAALISEDALRYMIRHEMVTGLDIKSGGTLG